MSACGGGVVHRTYERRLPRAFTGIWTPGRMYLCRELSRPQMDLLVEIDALSTDEQDRGCWASDRYLSRFLGLDERHVGKLVKALIDDGFLTRQVVEDAARPGGRVRFLKLTRKAVELWLPLDGPARADPERPPVGREEGWGQDAPTSQAQGVGAKCPEGLGAKCPPMSTKEPEELYEEKQQQQYLEYMGDSACSGSDEKAALKAALKAAAACLDIKSATEPDLEAAEAAGGAEASLAAGLIQTLTAWKMPVEIARRLVADYGPEAARYWVDRADGTDNPAGFVRGMLTSGAERASPAEAVPKRSKAEETKEAEDRAYQALYEKTLAENRARREGGKTTEEVFASAMTSLAEMKPWALAELERRKLLRERRLEREAREAR